MNDEIGGGATGSPLTVADLDYTLPEALIAQHPPPRRDDARLLILNRSTGKLRDARITGLPDLLDTGDLLVLNDTQVLPARFTARRTTGGKVRGLFLHQDSPGRWRVMLEGSRRLRVGESLSISAEDGQVTTLWLMEPHEDGHWCVGVDASDPPAQILNRIGETPLPPYIGRQRDKVERDRMDRLRYQTVYAKQPGAIAAPTAGLHFTDELLARIQARGVETVFVTLHVGVGTFKPIRVACLSQHVMHAERYELTPETVEAVRACRDRGGRVVAVGTTTVRVLESAASKTEGIRPFRPLCGSTDLFIYPPYRFQIVDALLTNFHLPRSTLLALVMAFGGVGAIRQAYEHAIKHRYRFYSYGDAMLIH